MRHSKRAGIKGLSKENFKSRVLTSYELHDDDDISTERLLQMVADDCHCDVSDVVSVLAEESDNGE